MRKIICCIVLLVITSKIVKAQSSAEQIADRIAMKMKDSLSLSDAQKQQILGVNMQLHNQKMITRQQYVSSDSLRIKLQRIENSRDSLYRQVLTAEQYNLYRQKKTALVNNN